MLRAPVDGRIAEAADLKIGAVVGEGDRLAAIVPDGPLRVVAQFTPAAAFGRVFTGQPDRFASRAFPGGYGSLRARVSRVANEVRDGLVRVELAVTGCRPRCRSATRCPAPSKSKSSGCALRHSSSERSAVRSRGRSRRAAGRPRSGARAGR